MDSTSLLITSGYTWGKAWLVPFLAALPLQPTYEIGLIQICAGGSRNIRVQICIKPISYVGCRTTAVTKPTGQAVDQANPGSLATDLLPAYFFQS